MRKIEYDKFKFNRFINHNQSKLITLIPLFPSWFKFERWYFTVLGFSTITKGIYKVFSSNLLSISTNFSPY